MFEKRCRIVEILREEKRKGGEKLLGEMADGMSVITANITHTDSWSSSSLGCTEIFVEACSTIHQLTLFIMKHNSLKPSVIRKLPIHEHYHYSLLYISLIIYFLFQVLCKMQIFDISQFLSENSPLYLKKHMEKGRGYG